ncbi:MAG: D-alanyl-D-alanine carboxypeptidase family protein [Sarcina sp.]
MNYKRFYLKLFFMCFMIFNLFNPTYSFASELPNIKATSALSVDLDTKEIIFSKNAEDKMQPASLTKLMTGFILSENYSKKDILIYTQNAMNQESSSIFLDFSADIEAGFEVSASTVMDGLLIYSGNDIATLISDNIAGTSDNFSKLMNEKAKALGMKNSKFYTANGLDSDDILKGNSHYTTAYDLYLLSKVVKENKWMMETMAKSGDISIDLPNDTPIIIKNTNNNLNKDGCIGGKTGYTDKAGRCLLTFYERDGRNLVGIILDSPTRSDSFKDMTKLMDYSFNISKNLFHKKGDVIDTKTINFKPFKFFGPTFTTTVNIVTDKDILFYSNNMNNSIKPKINLENISAWNLTNDSIVGSLTFNFKDSSQTFNLTTDKTTKNIIKEFKSFYIILAVSLLIIIIVIYLIRKKTRKRIAC